MISKKKKNSRRGQVQDDDVEMEDSAEHKESQDDQMDVSAAEETNGEGEEEDDADSGGSEDAEDDEDEDGDGEQGSKPRVKRRKQDVDPDPDMLVFDSDSMKQFPEHCPGCKHGSAPPDELAGKQKNKKKTMNEFLFNHVRLDGYHRRSVLKLAHKIHNDPKPGSATKQISCGQCGTWSAPCGCKAIVCAPYPPRPLKNNRESQNKRTKHDKQLVVLQDFHDETANPFALIHGEHRGTKPGRPQPVWITCICADSCESFSYDRASGPSWEAASHDSSSSSSSAASSSASSASPSSSSAPPAAFSATSSSSLAASSASSPSFAPLLPPSLPSVGLEEGSFTSSSDGVRPRLPRGKPTGAGAGKSGKRKAEDINEADAQAEEQSEIKAEESSQAEIGSANGSSADLLSAAVAAALNQNHQIATAPQAQLLRALPRSLKGIRNRLAEDEFEEAWLAAQQYVPDAAQPDQEQPTRSELMQEVQRATAANNLHTRVFMCFRSRVCDYPLVELSPPQDAQYQQSDFMDQYLRFERKLAKLSSSFDTKIEDLARKFRTDDLDYSPVQYFMKRELPASVTAQGREFCELCKKQPHQFTHYSETADEIDRFYQKLAELLQSLEELGALDVFEEYRDARVFVKGSSTHTPSTWSTAWTAAHVKAVHFYQQLATSSKRDKKPLYSAPPAAGKDGRSAIDKLADLMHGVPEIPQVRERQPGLREKMLTVDLATGNMTPSDWLSHFCDGVLQADRLPVGMEEANSFFNY